MVDVLNLELAHYDEDRQIARFTLPSGEILELIGGKDLWRTFSSAPDWELIVAEIRYRKLNT